MKCLNEYTVLVVDDDEILRSVIAFNLKKEGFNVYLAEGGMQAFELIKAHKIDIVISDVRMSKGDGISLLNNAQAYNPITPSFIIMTGYSEVNAAEFLTKGAKKVLIKPFKRKDLMSAVFEILEIPSGATKNL
jgi:DNA-binding NtrC family response regulator